MVVGRIPVRNWVEADAILELYAGAEIQADRSVLVTEGDSTQFVTSLRAQALFASQPGAVRHVLASDSREAVSAAVQKAWSSMGWLNFLGHGGSEQLGLSPMLSFAEVEGLATGAQTPLVTAFSCAVNRFEFPGSTSLGEHLLLSKKATAVIAPTGASNAFEVSGMAASFAQNLRSGDYHTLGAALLPILTDEAVSLGHRSTLALLGDPAVPLRNVSDNVESGVEDRAPGRSPGAGCTHTQGSGSVLFFIVGLLLSVTAWRRIGPRG